MRRQRNFLGPQGMGGMVSLWGASSLIRSIQTGTVAVSGTTAITAVDLPNSLIFFGGFSTNYSSSVPALTRVLLALTNATTVSGTRNSGTSTEYVGFTVVEFMPGLIKNVQRGTITLSGVLSNTAAITAVNTAKAAVLYMGFYTSTTTADSEADTRLALTDSTTVTATRGSTGNASIVGYQVVELY